MKNSFTPIIFAMICFLPSFLTGQSNREQNQILETGTSLRALQLTNRQSMAVDVLLRVSNIGSSGQDGVSIQLNDLTLLHPGPSLLFDYPALGTTSGNSMRIQPNSGKSYIKVSNIGSSGQDGVSLRVNSQCCLDSFFDVFYNLKTGTETHKYGITGDPDFDLLRLTTYNRTSSKLSEKIMSGNPVLAPAFFDITYDLPVGIIGTGFGNTPDDLCSIVTYDRATPKLQQHVTSGSPAAQGFFDVTYDLALGRRSVGFGFEPDDLCMVTTFDKVMPKLAERVSSAMTTGFFDISYDLNLGRETHVHGDPDFDLLVVRDYNKNNGKLKDSIFSHNLALNHSFFDISYDLALGTNTVVHGDPDFDLLRTTMYNKNSRRLKDSIYSHNALTNSFFDISYDLGLGTETVVHGDPDFDLLRTTMYNKNSRRLKDSIYSHNALTNSFFDISYDLGLGTETVVHGDPDFDLLRVTTFNKTTPMLQEKIYSRLLEEEGIFYTMHDLHNGEYTVQYRESDFDFVTSRTFDVNQPKVTEKLISNKPDRTGQFELYFDLRLGKESRAFRAPVPLLPGDPDFDLIHVRNYDRVTPKLQETISSSNPVLLNSFFDITYDLAAKSSKVKFNEVVVTKVFDSSTPKLAENIATTKPGFLDRFFDISYDLNARTAKVQMQDFHFTRTFDPATPMLTDRVASLNPIFSDKFFDISYNLSAQYYKVQFEDILITSLYNPDLPGISDKVTSLKPAYATRYMEISTDLAARTYRYDFEHIFITKTFDPNSPKVIEKISTSILPYNDCFLTYTSDISNINVPKQSTLASAAGGLMPLEMRYEYDAISRKIREVSTDLNSPAATLTLERRLLPAAGASSLYVSSKLEIQGSIEVQGSVSTPGPGPLMLTDNLLVNGVAHQIIGNVQVIGNQSVSGTKMFKIDHPLDPDNKYLMHSCIESPDMMNVYNGNVITDRKGYVTVKLPDYFQALNIDYRYQLTCMGQFAQAIVAEKIKDNSFVIRTDKPNVEVSWQVTGIRNDPSARESKYAVEVDKETEMKGKRMYGNQYSVKGKQ